MKENTLKAFGILILGAIAIPFLIRLWPTGTFPISDTESETPITDAWQTHSDQTYELSLRYPETLSQKPSAFIAGPSSVEGSKILTLIDDSTISDNTDTHFNGLSVYYVNLNEVPSSPTFDNFITAEQRAVEQQFQSLNTTLPVPPGSTSQKRLASHTATILSGFGSNTKYYIPWENQGIVVVGLAEESPNSFNQIAEDIIATITKQ